MGTLCNCVTEKVIVHAFHCFTVIMRKKNYHNLDIIIKLINTFTLINTQ